MNLYSRLTRVQRYTLEAMKLNCASQKEIAAAIGTHPSTVRRELRRAGMTASTCCFVVAQKHAESRELPFSQLPGLALPGCRSLLQSNPARRVTTRGGAGQSGSR